MAKHSCTICTTSCHDHSALASGSTPSSSGCSQEYHCFRWSVLTMVIPRVLRLRILKTARRISPSLGIESSNQPRLTYCWKSKGKLFGSESAMKSDSYFTRVPSDTSCDGVGALPVYGYYHGCRSAYAPIMSLHQSLSSTSSNTRCTYSCLSFCMLQRIYCTNSLTRSMDLACSAKIFAARIWKVYLENHPGWPAHCFRFSLITSECNLNI